MRSRRGPCRASGRRSPRRRTRHRVDLRVGCAPVNQAMAVSAADLGIGSVLGLVLGVVSRGLRGWRFYQRADRHRHHCDRAHPAAEAHGNGCGLTSPGRALATWACNTVVLIFTQGPPLGWMGIRCSEPTAPLSGRSWWLERTAENPLVPSSVQCAHAPRDDVRVLIFGRRRAADADRVALYVQVAVLGYSGAARRHQLPPVRDRVGISENVAVARVAPLIMLRRPIIGGGSFVLGAML